MAKLMHRKIPASTLVEVLIAMVIIMVVFSVAMRIFGNVLSGGVSAKKVQVQQQLNVLGKEVIANGSVSVEQLKIDSVVYTLTSNETADRHLAHLKIIAVQNGRTLGKFNCLYRIKKADEED